MSDKPLPEIKTFWAAQGSHGAYDLMIEPVRGNALYYTGLSPRQKSTVDYLVLSMLSADLTEDEAATLASALNKILGKRTFAPDGMSFPVGLYDQPVPDADTYSWHNADGTIDPVSIAYRDMTDDERANSRKSPVKFLFESKEQR